MMMEVKSNLLRVKWMVSYRRFLRRIFSNSNRVLGFPRLIDCDCKSTFGGNEIDEVEYWHQKLSIISAKYYFNGNFNLQSELSLFFIQQYI